MGEQAPRSRRSGTSERSRNRAGRRGPRRYRIILYVVGGLMGPGYWLCGSVWDSRPFGKSPAEVHFTEFVLASAVVVVASWGLLLILGEALLFALAVFKADDREQYDIYRNLMILWGYVLTLGIPRHFRKLPAQFEGLADDDEWTGQRIRSQGGQGTRRDSERHGGDRHDGERCSGERGERGERGEGGRRGGERRDGERRGGERHGGERHGGEHREGERRGGERRDGERHGGENREGERYGGERRGGGRSQERSDVRDRAGYREPEYGRAAMRDRDRTRDRRSTRDRDDTRDRMVYADGEHPRDHVGCRDRTQDWPEPWDHEDARDSAGCRHRERPQSRPTSRDREDTRAGTSARERAQGRGTSRDREDAREGAGAWERAQGRSASRGREETRDGAGGRQHQGSLGPIFPPRPAAEAEVASVVPVPAPTVIVPPAAVTGQVVATIKGAVPDAELRNALDLLLRYAACLPVEETAPRPATNGGLKPFGIAAEAGGDA